MTRGVAAAQADEALLQQHYADLASKPFFPGLVKYMQMGPVVPMVRAALAVVAPAHCALHTRVQVWEGLNVVLTGRKMLGETNPQNSAPGTIRGDLSIQVGR